MQVSSAAATPHTPRPPSRVSCAGAAGPSHPPHPAHLSHLSHLSHPAHPAHPAHLPHPAHLSHLPHPAHLSHLPHPPHLPHPSHPISCSPPQVRVPESEYSYLYHRPWRERRRRLRPEHMPDERRAAHLRIHLELKFAAASIMKIYAQYSRRDHQHHRQLNEELCPASRKHEIGDDDEKTRAKQRDRNPLGRIFVVGNQRQLGQQAGHSEH